jgi:hypothetical protein
VTNYISQENCTNVAADTFTGTFIYASQYSSILCTIVSDLAGVLSIEYAFEIGGVADVSQYPTVAIITNSFQVPIKYPYFRVSWSSNVPGVTSLGIYTALNRDPPFSFVTLASAGGTHSLVNDGVGPDLKNKGLTAGSNITITPSATDITIASSSGDVTLTSAGGTYSLVSDGTGPAIANKGISTDGTITITDNGTYLEFGFNNMTPVPGGGVYYATPFLIAAGGFIDVTWTGVYTAHPNVGIVLPNTVYTLAATQNYNFTFSSTWVGGFGANTQWYLYKNGIQVYTYTFTTEAAMLAGNASGNISCNNGDVILVKFRTYHVSNNRTMAPTFTITSS